MHERALRLVYKDHNSTFDQLLLRDKSYSIHDRNLQKLARELYKVKHNLSPAFMHTIFPSLDNNFNLRKIRDFMTENIHTTYFGTETLSFRGPKTWDIVPKEIKESPTLTEFNRKIKQWKPEGCACRMGKVYINNLGFL